MDAVTEVNLEPAGLDVEALFHAHYPRVARIIAGVIRDPARAEELAVEVLLKWTSTPPAHGDGAEGWLYRTAVRRGLDELRRERRRSQYERVFGLGRKALNPHDLLEASEEQQRVRLVLSVLQRRQAELLLLRNNGLSYEQVAAALRLNPASVGTLLSRAQNAFRKEYVKRYGDR